MGFKGITDTRRLDPAIAAHLFAALAASFLAWRLLVGHADFAIWAGAGALAIAAGLSHAVAVFGRRAATGALVQSLERLALAEADELSADDDYRVAGPIAGESRPAVDRLHARLVELLRRRDEAESARRARRGSRAELMAEHAQLTEIVEGLADPVLAVDHDGELALANGRARELFGLKPVGADSTLFAEALRCEPLSAAIAEIRRRRGASQRQVEIVFGDGGDGDKSRKYLASCRSMRAAPDADPEAPQRVVVMLGDVTHQLAAQKRNAEFVAAVSHEMKTPLAGIKAYVELLIDGDAEDRQTQEEFLTVIGGQADRLQRLVNNLLNLARIEAGVVNVRKISLSLNEILEEAAGVVHPAAEVKRLRLTAELSSLYIGVLADRDMLLQSAINLLSNAVKYTPVGGQIWLRSRMNDQEISFEVEDTGVGLNETDCQKVFEKFYRVNASKEMASGTGLGLPLARHIVEDVHEGRLTVESTIGKGSTFRVTLPRKGK